MKKEAFQEIAKHFAESIKISLRFEAGACPSTNGKEIVLPTEMSEEYLDETLGALLHETNHIRYTDMKYYQGLDALTMNITNYLEDIRVDNKALVAYPNSRCFYMSLVDDAIKRNKEGMMLEEIPNKVLKALILDNFGVKADTLYSGCDDWDKVKKHLSVLLPMMADVRLEATTQGLAPIVKKVITELFGKQEKQEKKAKQPKQHCNNGQGGEGGNGESQEGEDSQEQNDNEEDSLIEKMGDIMKEFQESTGKEKELKEKAENIQKEANKHAEAHNKAARSAKCYNTKIRNNRYSNDSQSVRDAKEKKYQEALAERRKIVDAENKEYAKECDKRRAVEQQIRGITDKAREMTSQMNELASEAFSTSKNSQLLGFNALDKEQLMDKNYVDVPYNVALDELIKEVLILKQEEYQQEDTGKLNLRRLHEVFTEPDNMFIEKDSRQIQTRVSLVVDVSGSMDSYGACTEDRRSDCAISAVNIIATAFQKAIKAGAPGDMKIYAFGDNAMEVLSSVENFTPFTSSDTLMNWRNKGCGGSTNLADCVNHVVNDVNGDPEYRNIIIIITDAEVDGYQIQTMVNNISTGDVKVLYVAVGSYLHEVEAQELFGDSNITDKENALTILQNVMIRGLYTIN